MSAFSFVSAGLAAASRVFEADTVGEPFFWMYDGGLVFLALHVTTSSSCMA